MEYKKHDGILYEVAILSLSSGDDVAVELTDMSPDGGLLAEARVSPKGVTLVHQEPMPVEIFGWWAAEVVATGGYVQAHDTEP